MTRPSGCARWAGPGASCGTSRRATTTGWRSPGERRGLCPASLAELNGGAPLADAWGNALTMTCSPVGTRFAVTSAGPDGFLGTGDDLSTRTSARPVARLLRD